MGQKVQGFRADLQYFSLCGEESRAAESESKEGDSQLSKESCHAQLLRGRGVLFFQSILEHL